MKRLLAAFLALLVCASAADAKLEIEQVQSVYGPLLPERRQLEFYPQDLVFFRYMVVGAQLSPRGEVDCAAVVRLTDDSGKAVVQNTIPFQGPLSLGGNAFAGAAYVLLNDQLVNGVYTLTCTVTDHLASEKASFSRAIRVRPADFAIVHPRFSYDADGKAPAPVGGLVNQTLHFRIGVQGFDRSQDRVDLASSIQVLDDQGKPLLPQPLETMVKSADAKAVKATSVATFSGSLHLHRPGVFTLRITVHDRIGQKSATLEFPLTVAAP